MRVCLATSPHVRHPVVLSNDFALDPSVMYSFAPVGLLSLFAVLRESSQLHPVFYDLNREIRSGTFPLDSMLYSRIAESILERSPDVIGFMTECDSYHHVLQITKELRRRSQCAIILGGPHATAVAEPTLQKWDSVDAIVLGEGERSFPDLLGAILHGSDAPVGGVIRRMKDGSLCRGQAADLIEDLDDLPIPAYEQYKPDPEEEVFVEVGRGCPFQCSFCSTAPFWRRKHRVKSPGRIASEVALLQRLFDVRRVHFVHDLFTTDERWVRDVCGTLIAIGNTVRWTCSARTDTVDEGLLEVMRAAGCDSIYFGLESGSSSILKEIHKNIPIDLSLRILEACTRADIKPNVGFILGFPQDNEESFRETFDVFERSIQAGARPAHIFGYCPFAQSTLYSELADLKCSGHFVDLPVSADCDAANRGLVSSNRDLFGSFFRPPIPVREGLNEGVDEFSPLVDAFAGPALQLSQCLGSMFELYCRWVSWISARNDSLSKPPSRRFYGTPIDFADFVIEHLENGDERESDWLLVAKIIRINLLCASALRVTVPNTIANYRSFAGGSAPEQVQFDDQLTLGNVVATLKVDRDVTALLDGAITDRGFAIPTTPLHLVWQSDQGRQIRLLKVDAFVFHAIAILRNRAWNAGEMLLDWVQDENKKLEPLDFADALAGLTAAARAGLICSQ